MEKLGSELQHSLDKITSLLGEESTSQSSLRGWVATCKSKATAIRLVLGKDRAALSAHLASFDAMVAAQDPCQPS
eukprot:460442-Amphidinium_carterae.2